MGWLARWLAAFLISVCLTACAHAQLALDGSSATHSANVFSVNLTLTTSSANDLIVVDAASNGSGLTASGVTATGLTFTKHSSFGVSQTIERWSAVASSALSGVTITVTQTNQDFLAVTAYGISGANTSSPWDSGGPQTGTDPISITTVNANTMVIGTYKMNSTASPTAGTGFTQIAADASSFHMSEYKIVSATGTYSVTLGTGAGDSQAGIVDAVVKATGGGPTCPQTLALLGVGC